RTVQKECTAVNKLLHHVVLVNIGRIVACHKVCLMDQVCRFDRQLTETEVRHCNTAGLLGVIVKVSLCVHICVVTDDLDGVLVRSDCTVSAESPEFTVDRSFRCCDKRLVSFQRQMCHIVLDTECEFLLLIIVIYSNDLSRSRILGTKSVASCIDRHCVEFGAFERCDNIQIQRLA